MDFTEKNLLEQMVDRGPAFWGKIGARLSDIRRPLLPEDVSEQALDLFVRAEKKCAASGRDALFLFRVRAVAEALVFKESGWIQQPCLKSLVPTVTGLPETLASGYEWTVIPCLLATEIDNYVRYVIVGLRPEGLPGLQIPAWAGPCMDGEFQTSIRDASALISAGDQELSIICFPIAGESQGPVFNGDSAGLAMYLGLRSLFEKKNVGIHNVAATGVLTDDGRIGRVGFVQRKKTQAFCSFFDVFLYPYENKQIICAGDHDGICLQVRDPEQAYALAGLMEHSSGETLNDVYRCFETPESFAAFCVRLPDHAFGVELSGFCDLAQKIITQENLLVTFLKNFRTIAELGRYGIADRIADVFDPLIRENPSVAPELRADWLLIHLVMANHRGRVDRADALAGDARQVLRVAMRTTKGRELFKWLNNYEFVLKRHNRYDFRPEMPDGLGDLISRMENDFQRDTADIDGASDDVLASIYGTLCQNYGFCGPSYLEDTLYYAEKAVTTFGGMNGPNRADCLRQHNYMTYAFLDAGEVTRAETHLLCYLQKASLGEACRRIDTFSEWEHALTARFLADAENRDVSARYLNHSETLCPDARKHPWQLWYYNLARMAWLLDQRDRARDFARKSLALCLSTFSGDTIRAMALLPLSFLRGHDLIDPRHLSESFDQSVKIACSVNPDFFLGENPNHAENTMESIQNAPQRYFPFSYR